MSLISHTYNVTTEENITELEEEITYDVTELRMDPDYIRFVLRENVEFKWIQILYQDEIDLMDSDSFVLFNKEK